MAYDYSSIESRWQDHWQQNQTFQMPNPGDSGFRAEADRYFVLDMFPYPSGVGLHVGHPLGYIATDIVARHQRMLGKNVLHPMGFDAFGLPAEQYAIETGVHPATTTTKNIANMKRQLQKLGLSYDWSRELSTTDPDYYRWTQWIFLQLYNSWYDPTANDGRGAARPMDELVQALEGEDYLIDTNGYLVLSADQENMAPLSGDPVGLRKWHELTPDQQERLLDEERLAYLAEVPVNWCPNLGTVLANEEVTADGKSERGNHQVYKRPLRQWMLRITKFADRLIEDLDDVDWPEPVKLLQRNWVGKSTGAEVEFAIKPSPERSEGSDDIPNITVFTTRPDTLFGATYMVLAPEHPLVHDVTTDDQRQAVEEYQTRATARSDVDRQADTKEKTGVFTGGYAINPVTDKPIPIWISDYVMMGYGTGAIMAVPAHDQRDFEFATKFKIPVIQVVQSHAAAEEGSAIEAAGMAQLTEAYTGDGPLMNSQRDGLELDGLSVTEAKAKMIEWLELTKTGQAKVQYKLRDWLFSRQRYWGEPFPILHELDDQGKKTGRIRGVPEDQLPVSLPEMTDFKPSPVEDDAAEPAPPLSRADDSWKYLDLDGQRYVREFNTMPQWAGSCWYYLRYCDPKNADRFISEEAEQYWMGKKHSATQAGGVDLYVGGVEHAVLHLLYARFWHKVLFDLGHLSTAEPFGRLFNQGYIQAYAYTDERSVYVPAEKVEEREGQYFLEDQPVNREFGKMGKSLKNAIAPDEIAEQYGTDTLRLYEMYMGPLDQSKIWNTRDIVGVHRFLQRVWRNFVDDSDVLLIEDAEPSAEIAKATHATIARVTEAMENMSFNVAIAALIELNNELVSHEKLPRWVAEQMLLMLSPMAPHICEELWHRLGHEQTIAYEGWPTFDPDMLVEDEIELPVQVLGKLRGKIIVSADADEDTIVEAAKADPNVAQHLEGKTIRKVIVVPGRLVNLVAN